jgi:hypothetical protein
MSPPDLSAVEAYAIGNVPNTSLPPFTQSTLRHIRQALVTFRVGSFIALPIGHYQVVSRYVSDALGERPQLKGGVLVWYGVRGAVQESILTVLKQDRARDRHHRSATGQCSR